MTPETEQKLNGFVDSWNYTNRLIGAALALCVCGPFILFFVLGLISGIFAVSTLHFLPCFSHFSSSHDLRWRNAFNQKNTQATATEAFEMGRKEKG